MSKKEITLRHGVTRKDGSHEDTEERRKEKKGGNMLNQSRRIIPARTIDLVRGCLELLRVEEKVGVLEWAQGNMILPSETSNKYGAIDVYWTPYMIEIYNRLESREVRQMTLMFGAQLSKTTFIMASMFRNIAANPATMIMALPTEKMAIKFSKEKLQPTIDANRVIHEKIYPTDDTILHKGFKGGFISILGAKVASNLAMSSAKYAYTDEIDRFEKSAGVEGDPMRLIRQRISTYEGEEKLVATGTPTIKGKSNIDREYSASSMAVWELPCPHCGTMQPLEWPQVKWEGKTSQEVGDIQYLCKYCGTLAPESAWKKGNQRAGAWKHQNPDQRAHLGYHLNQLASAHRSWYAIVCEWLDIQNSTEIEKQENLKVFINTVLAELWEDVVFKHDHSDIYKRREKYDAELPDDVCLLTMGVDIQKGWLEFEIVGWGATGTWGIIHQKLYGNLSESFIWDQLDLFRRREYKFASGEGLYIYGTGIDTGYDSQRVYDYVAARESERVYGTKGSNNINAPVFAGKSLTADKKCTLYTIGVGALKENLMNSVDIAPGNVGYLHFPKNKEKGYDEEYCKGLMAEHKEEKNGKMQWVQHYKRNEPIDCRNEATFPLYINGINIVNISKLTREQQREISAKGYIMYDAPARKKIVDEGLE